MKYQEPWAGMVVLIRACHGPDATGRVKNPNYLSIGTHQGDCLN